MLHMTDNHSTTFQREMCSKGLNERVPGWGALYGIENHTNEGYVSNSHHVGKQLTTANVCNSDPCCTRQGTASAGPNLPAITNMTCTFLSKDALSNTYRRQIFQKARGACQNKSPPEWQASTVCVTSACLRRKDGLSGAGRRPKMTGHWSQRYCRYSFLTQWPLFFLTRRLQRQHAGWDSQSFASPKGKTVTQSSSR